MNNRHIAHAGPQSPSKAFCPRGGPGRGPEPSRLWTVSQAAAALGVSPRTIERWLAQGLPHGRQGHPRRLVLAEMTVRAWLRQQWRDPDRPRWLWPTPKGAWS